MGMRDDAGCFGLRAAEVQDIFTGFYDDDGDDDDDDDVALCVLRLFFHNSYA